ncbi:hypothetical protein Q4Q35_16770 [Flavivirga aquimarina]|uniref:Uncharacterized protein n=1 Tax=Flavivirga aquimarina TaxID=2027862 RepID=A0ABT8WE73_9FLAO|nr:hypothetical protein [Flavivirga aquimarina]MDO5971462.1 hypothetical protein [Flavivirga aquimarina]
MKHFFKTLFITTLLFGTFQSCTSDETITETISNEKISSSLLDIIYVTAETKNDYNLINFDCEVDVSGGFLNSQGDYYGGIYIEASSWNDELMSAALEQAYLYTDIWFTKDDFSILYITPSVFFGEVYFNKNDIIAYFEDCSFEGDTKTFPETEPVKVSDVNFNCSGTVHYYIDELANNATLFTLEIDEGVEAVEDALSLYNDINDTVYVLDDLRSGYVTFTSPGGTSSLALGKTQIMNYFEDCILDRDYNDCINFKYPFVINKIDLQTDDIIPVTVTSDADLFQQNFTDVNITIDYPITLVTLNNDTILVESNEELENVLTNSADYCIDEW